MDAAFEETFLVVSPLGRRTLLVFSILSAAVGGLFVLLDGALNPIPAFGVGLMGIALMAFSTHSKRRYFTPLVFSTFYCLGFSLSWGMITWNKSEILVNPMALTGAFSYVDSEVYASLGFLIAGAFAIPVSSRLAERTFGRSVRFESRLIFPRLKTIVVMWLVSGVALSLFLGHLQIGRTGLTNVTALPFHMAGFLSYARSILFPAVGFLLLDAAIQRRLGRLAVLAATGLVGLGLLNSLFALSRSQLGLICLAMALYGCVRVGRSSLTLRAVLMSLVLLFLIMPFAFYYVSVIRDIGFSAGGMDAKTSINLLASRGVESMASAIHIFLDILISRVGGLQQLLAVSSAPDVFYWRNPLEMFLEDPDTTIRLNSKLINFTPVDSDFAFTGMSLSLWGSLATSGSLPIVFIGTMLSCFCLMGIEEVFFREKVPILALIVVVYLGIMVWGFSPISVYLKLLWMPLVLWLTIRSLRRRSG